MIGAGASASASEGARGTSVLSSRPRAPALGLTGRGGGSPADFRTVGLEVAVDLADHGDLRPSPHGFGPPATTLGGGGRAGFVHLLDFYMHR